jgi:hypothetical protein
MDNYFEHAVLDYLKRDRSVFVNAQYCIQINPGRLINNRSKDGPVWYCDAVAVNLCKKEVYLCECSYAYGLTSLIRRLGEWHNNWNGVLNSVVRDGFVPESWPVRPWLFVPRRFVPLLENQRLIDKIANGQSLRFEPRITPLEEVVPWLYDYTIVPGSS